MTYILFYLVTITYLNGPMTSGTAEFGSKERCLGAGQEVEDKFGGKFTKVTWFCTEKD